MEDNIYKIQENINRIFIEIEENAGEITEEQLEQLNINQENLKQKLSDYNKAIQVYKNYNEGVSNEIKRLQELKKTRTNRIEVLRNTMKNAVINFGSNGKSGNKVIELEDCKLFTKSTVSVIENKERLDILRYEFIEYCRELYKNDLLITGDDIDIQGLIDAINAKCIAERGEAFVPFTIYDFICTNITFKFTVSLKNLIESNNYLLQAYYGLDYSTGVDIDIDYGADYTDAIFNIIIELVYKHNIKSINYTDILNKISRLINNYPVTPIDLNNEYNTCIYINKDENNKWYYNRAYKIIVDTVYNLIDNKELYIPRKEELFNKRIYITRGGVIAGEYINKCYIKHNNFYPRDPVIINCSRITNHDDIDIYTVDSRSPKLKVLKEFYNVSINIDDKYKHIDIRKFKKL